jgi:hypothetical protein
MKKNSYEIIKWEVTVGKELLTNQQFNACTSILGYTLDDGTICRRKQRPTFQNRERLYQFSKRMDLYSVWIDSAMVYMKKGITKGICKIINIKVIPI